MSQITTLAKRELTSYFVSPIAYVVAFSFLFINGFIFWILVDVLNKPNVPHGPVMQYFFGGTIFFWLYLMSIAPVITMRLIAEERKSGTIETLMTAPLSDWDLVLGKYLSSILFFVILWLPTTIYVMILELYSSIDYGPIVSGYLGTLLIGFLFLAAGLLTSSVTKNQIIASILSFGVIVILCLLGFLEYLFTDQFIKEIFSYTNIWSHMGDFGKGIVDTRHIVYYLSLSFLFLYFTTRVVEARKWQ